VIPSNPSQITDSIRKIDEIAGARRDASRDSHLPILKVHREPVACTRRSMIFTARGHHSMKHPFSSSGRIYRFPITLLEVRVAEEKKRKGIVISQPYHSPSFRTIVRTVRAVMRRP